MCPLAHAQSVSSHLVRAWCCGALLLGAGLLPTPVGAQTKPAATKAKTAPAAKAATQAYAAGIKAFDTGKAKTAITSLSSALRQGGLPPQKMAKALFYRGVAYRKQGKPAQAISDLTSAVWIKGGLSDADRVAALDERKVAYKEAGLGANVPQGLKPGAGVPSTAVARSVPVTPPTVAVPQISSSSSGAATSAWQTTAATAAKNTQPPVAAATPPSSPPATTLSPVPGANTPPVAAAQPGSSGVGTTFSNIGSSISQGLSGVGSFFGNVFSSNAAQPAAPANNASQIATSSTARTPGPTATLQPLQTPSSAPAAPVTQGWALATKPAVKPTVPPRQPAQATQKVALNKPPQAAPAKPKPRAVPAGKFRLQVAAVRSEAKAQHVVSQLRSKYAGQLAGATAQIDATAIGNMGTFYRVRVGPYADTKTPRSLCAVLKQDGFDCLIVTP